MIRKPKRDMNRRQAPHGRGGDWEMRWRGIWGRQRVSAKGLSGGLALAEYMKAIYGDAMPPGSPRPPRLGFASLFPHDSPLMRLVDAR